MQEVDGPVGRNIAVRNVAPWLPNQSKIPSLNMVTVFEKLVGLGARYVMADGQMHVGSKDKWYADTPDNPFWGALYSNPQVTSWCTSNPGMVLYVEIRDDIYTYNISQQGKIFVVTDCGKADDSGFLNVGDLMVIVSAFNQLVLPPKLYNGPYNGSDMAGKTSGPSMYPGATCNRKGAEVRPDVEMPPDQQIGRIILDNNNPNFP